MTITAFSQWSVTASANVDLNNIPLDSSVMLAGQIDDAFREMMAQLKAGVAPLASPTFTGILTHAGQLKFPSTANPSSDANTLDDYRELNEASISQASGIAAGSGTLSSANGKRSYTRIGRQVTATWDVTIVNKGTGGTSLVLTLPFTAAAAGGPWAGAGVESSGNTALAGTIAESGTTVVVRDAFGGGDLVGNGITITFTITYWA